MQFQGFQQEKLIMRHYYKLDTGRFYQTTTDDSMIVNSDPYILKPKGWKKQDYKVVDGAVVYDPLPARPTGARQ